MQRPSPLMTTQLSAGAVTETRYEQEVAATFGDTAGEVSSVRSRCGVVDLGFRRLFSLSGGDRASFLHGQCTNEVVDLIPGQGRVAFILDGHGRNQAMVRYLVCEDEIVLETDAASAADLDARLRKYMVIEDVHLECIDDSFTLMLLAGPDCRRVLADVIPDADLPDDEGDFARVSLGSGLLVMQDRETGEDGALIRVAVNEAEPLWRALTAVGATPVGFDAYDILRTEAGRPWRGCDYGEDCLPEETGQLERAVSFSKGCYVGQEQVAKQHYRGKPRKMVCGLLPESAGISPGDGVTAGKTRIGTIGTVKESPTLDRPIALALLKGPPEIGSDVLVSGTGEDGAIAAAVAGLPFFSS